MPKIENGFVAIAVVIIILLIIFLYVTYAMFLNKLNKVTYGKTTPMAWIPFSNTYLLGKLTFGKVFGWIMLVGLLLMGTTIITINFEEKNYSTFPQKIQEVYDISYSLFWLAIYIYAGIKYKKLLNAKNTQISMNNESDYYQTQNISNQTNNDVNDDFYSQVYNSFYNQNNQETIVTNNNFNSQNSMDNSINNISDKNINIDAATNIYGPSKENIDLFTPVIQSVPQEEKKDDTEVL